MKYLCYVFLCLIIISALLVSIPSVEYVRFEKKTDYISYFKSFYNNDDIVGVIKVGKLSEVLVKGNNNDYYLKHNLYKEEDYHGSIFIDYRNNLDDKIVLVYGHNSIYGDTPFSYLENYYDEYFLFDNNIITLCGVNYCYKYVIFSVFVETYDWFYMDINAKYDEYLDTLVEKSWFISDIRPNIDDKIVILQTCSYHPNYLNIAKKYLIIAAKKV